MVTIALNGSDITGMVTKIEWAGSDEEVARTCDISYINAPYDQNVKNLPVPTLGNYITMAEDGEQLFSGRITGSEKSSGYGTVTANCVEDSQLLAKNKCKYNFCEPTTPEAAVEMILADYGFPVGSLVSTGIEITSMIINGDSIIDAIAKLYGEATKKNGKKYRVYMHAGAFCVEEKGDISTEYVLSEGKNITESHYTEKSDYVVNRVVLYDKNGNRTGEVTNGESMGAYGTYTEIVSEEINVDAETQANSMMQDPEQTLSVTALGNSSCIAGRAISLSDSATGMYGLYWIKSDRHTWENNVHTMQLELDFREVS